jgi:hypothetical protein
MNCVECRDNLVACAEGLLEREPLLEMQAHLKTCADCAAEYRAITDLQQRLAVRGQATAEVSIVGPVMRRVLQEKKEKESVMSKIFKYRWGFGLSAAAGAAAIILIAFLALPKMQVTAAEVMARGAQAVARLTSIHLRGELRTLPADNFSYINADCPFYPIELWEQFGPDSKWRIEKPLRVAVMDGDSTTSLIKNGDIAAKIPKASINAFELGWLQQIANLSNTITNELTNALAKGWKMTLTEGTGTNGRAEDIVTIEAKSGLPADDYLKNQFFETADTRRVYVFDDQTEKLESAKIYLHTGAGDILIFKLDQIDYNQPIDPSEWKLDLPADVSWYQNQMQMLPDNQKYASMTAEQAARAFFEACSRENWSEAEKFLRESPVDYLLKEELGGLEIINLGTAFTSQALPDQYVPYEIRLRPQKFYLRVSNGNPAKRYVITGVYDSKLQLLQELKWTTAPAILSDNDAYSKLSPTEVVRDYFAAQSRLDWNEMRKFAPEYDVESDQAEIEAARKEGLDVYKLIPSREVGDAFWSAERSAWFVKYIETTGIKKMNLALRRDKPTGRWFVDGGW